MLLLITHAHGQMGDREGEIQSELPPEFQLPPAPVLTPAEALESFTIEEGFRIELVAAEPLVEDPIAMCFAPDGRLWVLELRSYMPDVDGNNEESPISRVVILEDEDGDGSMDTSTVFMDNLILPRALALSHDGLLIVEPPNLLFCRDLDGDDTCDHVKVLATGFAGIDGIEHAGNGLLRGIDNTFHNSQHHWSFDFDGNDVRLVPVPAHGQWGITQDDHGRLYYSPNSDPILVDELPKTYASHGGRSTDLQGIGRKIVRDKSVWPVRPTPGINRGYQPDMLTDHGRLTRFTAACGPMVYRDDLLGSGFEGDVFVCEPAGNLLKRYTIDEDSRGRLRAAPTYPDREFLASTDERFRPVNLVLGPEGAIYVLDFYRGIIQHRIYVTSFLRKQILQRELDKPVGMGRIWRIVPDKTPTRPVPDLNRSDPIELADHVTHPNGTVRDLAQRLLVERPDPSSVRRLVRLSVESPLARDRFRALWTLEGMDAIEIADVLRASEDESPLVRTAAIRIGERWIDDPEIESMYRTLGSDPVETVRVQAILSSSRRPGSSGIQFMLEMLDGSGPSRATRSAVIAGLAGREREFLSLVENGGILEVENGSSRAILSEVVKFLLDERSPGSRTELLEFAATQSTTRPWQASVVLDRLCSAARTNSATPVQLRLRMEPEGWTRLVTDADALDLPKTLQLDPHLWWPGRVGVQEFIPDVGTGEVAQLIARGKRVYNICISCHQVDGAGLAPLYPPLAGSEYVLGDPDRLSLILLHGLHGPIRVAGRDYDQLMPPAPVKNDEDLAAVMTYIRQAWDNTASAVMPEDVTRIRGLHRGRGRPWTITELDALSGN